MQRNLYKYCGIDPISFWKYTPYETELMISTSIENMEFEYDIRNKLEARLCAVVLNANGVQKTGKKPFDVDDFMPKKRERARSAEELEHMALAATQRMGGEVNLN